MVGKERQYDYMIIWLYDRYYLQNCKTIRFEKITDQTKYK